jgi:recombinational DNA repair ATPase RecF
LLCHAVQALPVYKDQKAVWAHGFDPPATGRRDGVLAIFRAGNKNIAASDFASEGQLRTLALALKLAQGKLLEQRSGKLPIYLMDDIFGELDPGRRNALMNHLPAGAQKWITTTHLDWLKETRAVEGIVRLRVAAGKVS